MNGSSVNTDLSGVATIIWKPKVLNDIHRHRRELGISLVESLVKHHGRNKRPVLIHPLIAQLLSRSPPISWRSPDLPVPLRR